MPVVELNNHTTAAGAAVDHGAHAGLLDDLMARAAPCFARRETRLTCRDMVNCLAELEDYNCWTLAKAAGHPSPCRMQHLLSRASCDEQQLLDSAADWAAAHLTAGQDENDVVLIVDETADAKSSADCAGAACQYSGALGRSPAIQAGHRAGQRSGHHLDLLAPLDRDQPARPCLPRRGRRLAARSRRQHRRRPGTDPGHHARTASPTARDHRPRAPPRPAAPQRLGALATPPPVPRPASPPALARLRRRVAVTVTIYNCRIRPAGHAERNQSGKILQKFDLLSCGSL